MAELETEWPARSKALALGYLAVLSSASISKLEG